MEVERKKGLRLSNAVNTAGRWSNVCSKSQIVSAKLKGEEEERKKLELDQKKKKNSFTPRTISTQTDRPANMWWDE